MRYLLAFFILISCYAEYTPRINLVVDYDQDTKDILGSSTDSYISNLIFASKLIVRNELGIDLNIIAKRQISLKADNYRGNLEVYKNYLLANPVSGANAYHLIQGGSLGITGLGLSYQSSACTSNLGISTSKLSTFNLTIQTIVHEVAHSIGAKHNDSDINLMNSSNQTPSFNFNPSTRLEINDFIKKSCLASKLVKYPSIIWNRSGTIKKINDLPKINRINYLLENNSYFRKSTIKKINKKNSFLIEIKSGNQSYYLINKLTSTNIVNNLGLIK